MNISDSHMEETVRALKAKGFTKFFKCQGYINIGNVSDHEIHIGEENNPALEWDDKAPLKKENFWVLHSYNGLDYDQLIIPPDDVQDIEDWQWLLETLRYSGDLSLDPENQQDEQNTPINYKERLLCCLESLGRNLPEMGNSDRYKKPYYYLRQVISMTEKSDLDPPEILWELVYYAFEAGKKSFREEDDAREAQDTAKRMKTMHENQQAKTRESRLPWTKHAEALILRNPSISAQGIAKSLKEATICDFSEWRDEDGITMYSDSENVGSNDKTWEAFESAVSRLKKRLISAR